MKRKTETKIATVLRVGVVALVILLQLALMIVLAYYLSTGAIVVYAALSVAALIQIMVIVSRNLNSSYTIAWVLIIMLMPVFGNLLYLLWGRSDVNGPRPRRIRAAMARGHQQLKADAAVNARLAERYPARKRIATYLERKGYPLYQNTGCKYYRLGEDQFEAMLAEMAQAKRFIFISTFILNTGVLWDRMREVLVDRAAHGVEVRLMFDDFGSLLTIPDNLIGELRACGIRAKRYNPIHRFISRLYIHYRNHQKITVIDGNVGYTGGTNISDEYVNLYEKHGHWKDTAIRLEGDAVWSMTVTFLEMWEGETGAEEEYNRYRPDAQGAGTGFFQPFADGPVNNPDNPAEVMYRNMITGAKEFVYITTPYLVINNNISEALCTAAESGVDVRLILPKVWDHWYVHAVSRSNYKPLLQAGARVYEYTPGFIHAKTVLADGDHAVTGSINMDYRSFYLHFENGVWICGDPVLEDMRRDIEETFAVSEEIFLEDYLARPWYLRFLEGVLRVFAVLL